MMTFLMIVGIINTIIVTLEAVLVIACRIILKREGLSLRNFVKDAFMFGYNYGQTDEDLTEEESQPTVDLNKYPWGDEPLIDEETKRRNEELDVEVDALLGRNQ